jgi:hypothetical protein
MDASGYEGDVLVDNLSDAVEAIQTELGTAPSRAFATVRERLDLFHDSMFHLPMVTNKYERPQPFGFSATVCELPNTEFALFFVPQRSCTLDRLGLYVSVAGGTGSVVRLGLRNYDQSTNRPGTLIVDGGTVSCTTTGEKTVTISQAVVAGTPYVLTCTNQGSPTPEPTVSIISGTTNVTGPWAMGSTTAIGDPTLTSLWATSTTGALPSTQTWVLGNSRTPLVWVRASD